MLLRWATFTTATRKPYPCLRLTRLGLVKATAAGASGSPFVSSTIDKGEIVRLSLGALLTIHPVRPGYQTRTCRWPFPSVCTFNTNAGVRAAAVDYFLRVGGISAGCAGKRVDAMTEELPMLDESAGNEPCDRAEDVGCLVVTVCSMGAF